MAKIFLDTNIYSHIMRRRTDCNVEDFQGHELFISPLSIHVLAYVFKYKVPNNELAINQEFFNIVPFDSAVTKNSLTGPTNDLEDNIQLHSAAEAECDFLLQRIKHYWL